MKKFLFSLLLFIFSIHGFSLSRQNIISFEDQKILLKNFGFRLVGVTNATSNKRIIGYVGKKVTYTPVVAFLANDIVEEFESFIKRNLMPAPDEHDLIVRVNDLTVYETHSNLNETAVANVNLTFIFKKDEHYFEKLTISHQMSKTVFEHVTQWLPEIIANAITQCFDTFYDRAMKHTLDQVEITEMELRLKPLTYNSNNSKLHLYIDKKKKAPLVNKIYSQKAAGIESMMTRKNRVCKKADDPNLE